MESRRSFIRRLLALAAVPAIAELVDAVDAIADEPESPTLVFDVDEHIKCVTVTGTGAMSLAIPQLDGHAIMEIRALGGEMYPEDINSVKPITFDIHRIDHFYPGSIFRFSLHPHSVFAWNNSLQPIIARDIGLRCTCQPSQPWGMTFVARKV